MKGTPMVMRIRKEGFAVLVGRKRKVPGRTGQIGGKDPAQSGMSGKIALPVIRPGKSGGRRLFPGRKIFEICAFKPMVVDGSSHT